MVAAAGRRREARRRLSSRRSCARRTRSLGLRLDARALPRRSRVRVRLTPSRPRLAAQRRRLRLGADREPTRAEPERAVDSPSRSRRAQRLRASRVCSELAVRVAAIPTRAADDARRSASLGRVSALTRARPASSVASRSRLSPVDALERQAPPRRAADVLLRRALVADREADHVAAVQLRVRRRRARPSRSRAASDRLVVASSRRGGSRRREGMRRDDLPAGLVARPSPRRARARRTCSRISALEALARRSSAARPRASARGTAGRAPGRSP